MERLVAEGTAPSREIFYQRLISLFGDLIDFLDKPSLWEAQRDAYTRYQEAFSHLVYSNFFHWVYKVTNESYISKFGFTPPDYQTIFSIYLTLREHFRSFKMEIQNATSFDQISQLSVQSVDHINQGVRIMTDLMQGLPNP